MCVLSSMMFFPEVYMAKEYPKQRILYSMIWVSHYVQLIWHAIAMQTQAPMYLSRGRYHQKETFWKYNELQ